MDIIEKLKEELAALAAKANGPKKEVIAFAEGLIVIIGEKEALLQSDDRYADLAKALEQAKADLVIAQELAEDAINKYNTKAEEVATLPTLEVEVDGKKFTINHGVNLDGTNYTVEDLKANPTVVKQLVEMQSGAISKVGDK